MGRLRTNWKGVWIAILCGGALGFAAARASASEVLLKDGRLLKGKLGEAFSLAEQNGVSDPEAGRIKQILFVDDDLRRTYISKRMVQDVRPDKAGQIDEEFKVRQPTPSGKATIKSVGSPAKPVGNFDDFGRRTFVMQTAQGPLPVIQAITEITPQWVKVEGLNYTWDMRIATSTIPAETLRKILWKQIDPKNIEHRKQIARFYLQSERYEEAQQALQDIITDFPEQTDIRQQLEPTIRAMRQLAAQRLLLELRLRREAGQHRLVQELLKKFPSEDVSGEILQVVRELKTDYETREARRGKVLKECESLAGQIKDTAAQSTIEAAQKELATELDIDTLPRMAAFMQNADDPQMTPDSKVALAMSGWMLGPDKATDQLPVAMAALRVRKLAEKYFAETQKLRRSALAGNLAKEQDNSAALLANLLANMKPPFELPELIDEKMPGYYKLEVTTMAREPAVTYYVQLPPEYNPYRHYPTIVTLHGLGSTAEQQVDWWAGGWSDKGRQGQATRYGYIVIAPEWTVEHQKEYEYSAREHAAVLGCLRDACRRFAIDTDRVFLSGHSMGGDAAWDMGLSHPDLWAGVIPIAAQSDRFCMLYWENAKTVPFYVVGGELDSGRMARNARDLDRYLRHGYNTTVVEYLGRGHEHFIDETLRLFDWMGRYHRDFFPREFTGVTMRQWDNFFWWTEVEGLPPGSAVNPAHWPPPRGSQPIQIKGSVLANNSLYLRAGTTKATIWLAPQMVNFKNRMNITVNGRRLSIPGSRIQPSVDMILEDVRTRGDRQHPFWAKVEVPSGRVNGKD